MKPNWKLLMALSLALALAGNLGYRALSRGSPLREERYLPSIFPEAESFSPKSGSPPHYLAFAPSPGGGRQAIGVAFLTSDVLPGERGYAGPIHTLVGLRNDGDIVAIRVISHRETPSYAAVIDTPEYWEKFAGKKPSDGFILEEDVDAISRATITAASLARSVRDASRIVAREVLRLDVPPPAGAESGSPWYRSLLVCLGAAGAVASYFAGRRWLRMIVLLWAVVVFGFWLGTYISLGQLTYLVMGRGAPIRAHLDWYLLLVISVLLALFLGNIFCGWLCPFGALQELAARVLGRTGAGRAAGRTYPEAEKLRWFYLWATLMAALTLGATDAVNYEPFGTVFDWKGNALHWFFLAVVLVSALFIFRFWCRIFCPVGLIMQLIASVKLHRRVKFSLQRDVLEKGDQG